ncbi:MAG: Asp-tRNA(Asn)/Glu-tRNA(Gln) amidotransferase subunit GatC [Candidatus Peribacteraceae bacterium]|nr:Asp-tRNA(Asn)/Glu-tRNA(Gln) amidotransferase subunit GatC [Candidatus Peribacteraceae bacterium]MBP9850809.1 Asp-tRNA(Asn)/Glu-tRNA(Gln) amidotransferase subunit GatC [Candidatus Peribacteraceae bacterium]
MSALTRDQVLHIATLARLTLTSEEIDKMTKELSSILTYIEVLNEVDTAHTEPTAQVTGLTNALRDDTVISSEAKPDDLLATSPLPITDHQITAPHAHG